jgi:Flp pilus assembly protein TadG
MAEHWRNEVDAGQEMVEYALVVPVFLLIILGIIEFGIIVLSYDTIANAAREGARWGIVHPDDTGGMETIARNRAIGLAQAALNVNPSVGGNTVRVEVVYDSSLISGWFVQAFGGSPTVRLRAVATMQREQ